MGISTRQYQDIMNEYDAVRRRNYMAEQERKERVYALIPEIRQIDEQIAHISVEKAKALLLKQVSNAEAKKSLQDTIYDLSMEKVNLLAIHDYPADYLDPIYDCPECKDTGYIGDKKCRCFQQKIRHILYSQSNIEDVAGTESFSAFRREYYSTQRNGREKLSPRENIENVLSASHSFIESFDSKPGQNLLIYGNAGVGKTFLSNCIAGELLNRGKGVIYLTSWLTIHFAGEQIMHRHCLLSCIVTFSSLMISAQNLIILSLILSFFYVLMKEFSIKNLLL